MNTNTPEYSAPSVTALGALSDLTKGIVKGSLDWTPPMKG